MNICLDTLKLTTVAGDEEGGDGNRGGSARLDGHCPPMMVLKITTAGLMRSQPRPCTTWSERDGF